MVVLRFVDDATLLAHIRTVIAESPFHGEGHGKIWARLRVLKQVRTSMLRHSAIIPFIAAAPRIALTLTSSSTVISDGN